VEKAAVDAAARAKTRAAEERRAAAEAQVGQIEQVYFLVSVEFSVE
jgi:hypothetical protein